MRIAISIPKQEFLILEKLKHKLKSSRSKLVQQAIEYWLAGHRERELIDRYEMGYKRKPEKTSHILYIEKSQYPVLSGGW